MNPIPDMIIIDFCEWILKRKEKVYNEVDLEDLILDEKYASYLQEEAALFLQQNKMLFSTPRDAVFSDMDNAINIQKKGMDMEVDIQGLDLSFIDEMNDENDTDGLVVSETSLSAQQCRVRETCLNQLIVCF